jgi:hypothetical protein
MSSEEAHLPVALPPGSAEDAGSPLIFFNEKTGWIFRDEQGSVWCRVCWLLIDLRGHAVAYSGKKVVVGAPMGAGTILDFSHVR